VPYVYIPKTIWPDVAKTIWPDEMKTIWPDDMKTIWPDDMKTIWPDDRKTIWPDEMAPVGDGLEYERHHLVRYKMQRLAYRKEELEAMKKVIEAKILQIDDIVKMLEEDFRGPEPPKRQGAGNP
jgi:hypothetical protein